MQRVQEGKGVGLKDLLSEDGFFVHDVSCSRSMVRWDCVLCRVYRSGERWYFVGNGIGVQRTIVPKLMERIERESREAGVPAAAFVQANSHRWHGVIDEMYKEQLANLKVKNSEGDDLEFCSAEYRVLDEAPLIAALEAARRFEAEERDDSGVRSFAWLEQGTDGPRRSYGHIELRNGALRLECNSRKRLDIGRQLVEKHGGQWMEHTGDSFQSLDSVKREAVKRKKPREAPGGSSLPPEIEREVVGTLKAEHYANWLDERLPALAGKTPREAARSETGRRALEDLLRKLENGEERERREGRAVYDVSILRKALGM